MNFPISIKFLLLSFIFISCGEINETERVSIDIRIDPEGAGNVLTSGGNFIGDTAEFFAVENKGWLFAGWSGDVNSFENPLTVELNEDIQIVGTFSQFVNIYQVDLNISDSSSSLDLSFGQKTGATDGFDSGIDLEAPPPPPELLHAWFDTEDLKLFDDFRNAFSAEADWHIKLFNASTGTKTLQWNLDIEEFSGSLILSSTQADIEIDMIENSSFEFESNDIDEFTISYRL